MVLFLDMMLLYNTFSLARFNTTGYIIPVNGDCNSNLVKLEDDILVCSAMPEHVSAHTKRGECVDEYC